MTTILILNGPNLNMLGIREPEIYGSTTLDDIQNMCAEEAEKLGVTLEFRQSNHEGALIDWIQEAHGHYDALAINAGAYTHTSVAIHDALKLLDVPIAEIHISNPKDRESFRHLSYIEPVARVHIAGQGAQGYVKALRELCGLIRA